MNSTDGQTQCWSSQSKEHSTTLRDRQRDRQTDRQTDRQQTDRQTTDRQTQSKEHSRQLCDRQTDRWMDKDEHLRRFSPEILLCLTAVPALLVGSWSPGPCVVTSVLVHWTGLQCDAGSGSLPRRDTAQRVMPTQPQCHGTDSCQHTHHYKLLEVHWISASVSAPNVDKWVLPADIRFRLKAVSALSVSAGCSW